jgi:hypothetical protein
MEKKNRGSALFVTNRNNSVINLNGQTNEPYEITADIDGVARMDRLVLVDQKTGFEWELSIHDGNIVIEPYELVDKRDFRIEKIIK